MSKKPLADHPGEKRSEVGDQQSLLRKCNECNTLALSLPIRSGIRCKELSYLLIAYVVSFLDTWGEESYIRRVMKKHVSSLLLVAIPALGLGLALASPGSCLVLVILLAVGGLS